jgi:hypothetical protein
VRLPSREELRPGLDHYREAVFDNAATLKIAMSQLAMHFPDRLREDIRSRINQVLDPSDWEDDSSLVRPSSFVTFIRSMVADKITRAPALGVSIGGDLLATWWNGSPELSLFARYYDNDRIELHGSAQGAGCTIKVAAGNLRQALRDAGLSDHILDDAQHDNFG